MSAGPLRIGVIGGGVAGVASAWMLQDDHQVTLLERAPRLGGHAETVPVRVGDRTVHAELGPRFFFEPSYPHFLALLRLLRVPVRWNPAKVSFTDVARSRSVVVPPSSARHVAGLLRSPPLVGHLLSLRRLTGEQPAVFARRDWSATLEAYLRQGGYPPSFAAGFAYPFFSACWGMPFEAVSQFPAYSLLKGMPRGDHAGFLELLGGTARYMSAFAAELTGVEVRVGLGVRNISRRDDAGGTFVVVDDAGASHTFDRLIVATSARDAAPLLRGVDGVVEMQAEVAGFGHVETDIVVHGDASLMPPDRRDWAHNNLFFDGSRAWMSDWPGLLDDAPVFRTWLPKGHPTPAPLYGRRTFQHLLMTPESALRQRRIASLQGAAGLWVTGMYAVDVDNHESALLSAIVPVQQLAPSSRNLRRLLDAVPSDAGHGLDVLPAPLAPSLNRAVPPAPAAPA